MSQPDYADHGDGVDGAPTASYKIAKYKRLNLIRAFAPLRLGGTSAHAADLPFGRPLIHSRSAALMRDCQPSPSARKAATMS
jgi:hypothetical protein